MADFENLPSGQFNVHFTHFDDFRKRPIMNGSLNPIFDSERDSKYGTIAIRGARKEWIELGPCYEADEDAFNRAESPTDSLDSH